MAMTKNAISSLKNGVLLNTGGAPSTLSLSPPQADALSKLGIKTTPTFAQPTALDTSTTGGMTRPPSAVAGSGPYASFANVDVGSIPQSFVDEIIQQLDTRGGVVTVNHNGALAPGGGEGFTIGAAGTPGSEQYVKDVIQQAWQKASVQEQQRYEAGDKTKIDAANSAGLTDRAIQKIAETPVAESKAVNDFFGGHVTPQLNAADAAARNQIAGDRAAEDQLTGVTNDYVNKVQGAEGRRSTNIDATNAAQNALVGDLGNAAGGANADDLQALRTVLEATGSANRAQGKNLQAFTGQNSASNAEQEQNFRALLDQYGSLNASDKAQYMRYLQQTDPLMAQRLAQGSNAGLVGNQTDVMNQYKALTSPQVTAQERALAAQARQKFESDDKASRDAVMQMLATRGLRSGGLVIANQQATQQQLAQDRMNAELGLQANAVGRSQQALAGYGTAANVLRNADDAMKQFQDTYAQNEAKRAADLALSQNQQGLTTNQNASDRAKDTFASGTTTVNNNAGRNQATYNAGTETTDKNMGRVQGAFTDTTTTTGTNYGRTKGVIDTGLDTNAKNDERYQSGIDKGEDANANVLGAQGKAIDYKPGHLSDEAHNANTVAGTGVTAGGLVSNTGHVLTQDEIDAILKVVAGGGVQSGTSAAGQN